MSISRMSHRSIRSGAPHYPNQVDRELFQCREGVVIEGVGGTAVWAFWEQFLLAIASVRRSALKGHWTCDESTPGGALSGDSSIDFRMNLGCPTILSNQGKGLIAWLSSLRQEAGLGRRIDV